MSTVIELAVVGGLVAALFLWPTKSQYPLAVQRERAMKAMHAWQPGSSTEAHPHVRVLDDESKDD